MRTQTEIIEAMLELQQRITVVKIEQHCNEDDLRENPYYQALNSKLNALKFVMGITEVIA